MKNQRKNFTYKYFKPVKAAIIILMLVFSLQFSQAMAQSNQFAPVDIDGSQLFRVASTNDYTVNKGLNLSIKSFKKQ